MEAIVRIAPEDEADVECCVVPHLEAILRNGGLYHRRWGRWPMIGWLEAFEKRGLVRRDGVDWVRASA